MRLAALLMAALLAACGAGGALPPGSAAAAHDPQSPAAPATAGCSWLLVSNPDWANVAFPDQAATYWVAAFPAMPGARLRIDGRYPQARYFSFNVYDPLLRPVDAITDYQILPRTPGANPYAGASAAAGGAYVAQLLQETRPEIRPANTLYTHRMGLPGGQTLPNPQITVIYRLYLAEGDALGGAPLPQLTLESADGTTAALELALCDPLPPEGLPGLVNEAVREQSYPPLVDALPVPIAARGLRFARFYGLPETLRVLAGNAVGFNLPLEPLTASDTGGGFLSNVDNAYLTAMASREQGELYLVRARAPSWARRPSEAPLGGAELRYWSLCTNEFVSQRFVACLSDRDVAVAADGWFTVVVSDPDQRPINATPEHGMNWLPWGGVYPDSVFIYRHMLPSPHYAEAVQNVPYGTPLAEQMGEYAPLGVYCDRATVESARSAARAFAACAGR